MFVLKPTSNVRAKVDAGTDVTFHISGYDIDETTGLGVSFQEAGTLDSTGVALVTTPVSGHSKTVLSLTFNVTGTTQRIITVYQPEDGTTQSVATRWGGPFSMLADETAEYTDAGWTVYDSNHVAKYSSATAPRLVKGSAPATPVSGSIIIYADSAGLIHQKDDAGLDVTLTESGMRDQNLLINGNFDYAQRQAPGTLTTYSNTTGRTYGADRWGVTNENTSVQYIRTDTSGTPQTSLQARMYGTYSKITTTGKLFISQVVEGSNTLHTRGRTVRLQMKLKASAAKTLRVFLIQNANAATLDTIAATFISAFGANSTDPTFGTNLSKIAPVLADNATIATSGLSCSATTSWQRFGGTFLLPTDYKNLVVVVGTDSQFVAADSFSISEAGLYDGGEVRDWAERIQAQQLQNCQRYYCKSFNVDTNPAQNAGVTTGEVRAWSPVGASTAFTVGWTWEFPVPMLKAPTLTLLNPSAANAQVRNVTLATDCTVSTATASGEKKMYISGTTPASTAVGNILGVHVTADAEI